MEEAPREHAVSRGRRRIKRGLRFINPSLQNEEAPWREGAGMNGLSTVVAKRIDISR